MKHVPTGLLYKLWFKDETSRKWHDSSLVMRSEQACYGRGLELLEQENWTEIKVMKNDDNPNEVQS